MAKNNEATDKQLRVLNFVNEQIKKEGYAPTVREICKALDLKSTSTVHGYLARLEKKGLIQKNALKPRTIRVVGNQMNPAEQKFYTSKEMVDVPIVGKVAAGAPLLAVENIEDSQVSGGLPKTIKLTKGSISNVNREAQVRHGNVSPVRMEIRYGKDTSTFELDKVFIDYIKTPQYIRLTQEQIDTVEDTSQILE